MAHILYINHKMKLNPSNLNQFFSVPLFFNLSIPLCIPRFLTYTPVIG